MLMPPRPSPVVMSPPWHTASGGVRGGQGLVSAKAWGPCSRARALRALKPGMMRWKGEPAKVRSFSPVQSFKKLSAVLGTTSVRSSKTTRPAGLPPMSTSKKTLGRSAITGEEEPPRAERTRPGAEKAERTPSDVAERAASTIWCSMVTRKYAVSAATKRTGANSVEVAAEPIEAELCISEHRKATQPTATGLSASTGADRAMLNAAGEPRLSGGADEPSARSPPRARADSEQPTQRCANPQALLRSPSPPILVRTMGAALHSPFPQPALTASTAVPRAPTSAAQPVRLPAGCGAGGRAGGSARAAQPHGKRADERARCRRPRCSARPECAPLPLARAGRLDAKQQRAPRVGGAGPRLGRAVPLLGARVRALAAAARLAAAEGARAARRPRHPGRCARPCADGLPRHPSRPLALVPTGSRCARRVLHARWPRRRAPSTRWVG